jgi:hypothetical protein
MKSTQISETTGVDVTAIATTAIKTVGEVAKSLTGMFMIGSIIFVIVIIGAVVAIFIILRKNCGVIKKGLSRADKVVPLPLKV